MSSHTNKTKKKHRIWLIICFFVFKQSDEDAAHLKDPIDMSKLSEKIAQSALTALVSYLDLLAASGLIKIGLRTTIHQENVK